MVLCANTSVLKLFFANNKKISENLKTVKALVFHFLTYIFSGLKNFPFYLLNLAICFSCWPKYYPTQYLTANFLTCSLRWVFWEEFFACPWLNRSPSNSAKRRLSSSGDSSTGEQLDRIQLVDSDGLLQKFPKAWKCHKALNSIRLNRW